jgi:single-stranded DNA-binding protein
VTILAAGSCLARTIKKGSHVLIEGQLVSYERPNGKGKKAMTAKITSWSIRADVVGKLDRGEPEPEAIASLSEPTRESSEETLLAWQPSISG